MERTRQKHFYKCENGHTMGSPNKETFCRAMPLGKPCGGKLKMHRSGGKK